MGVEVEEGGFRALAYDMEYFPFDMIIEVVECNILLIHCLDHRSFSRGCYFDSLSCVLSYQVLLL